MIGDYRKKTVNGRRLVNSLRLLSHLRHCCTMVNTPPYITAFLDKKYPLPPPVGNNIADTPPQKTLEERRSLRKLLKARRQAKNRLLQQHHNNMDTNNNDDDDISNNNNDNPVTPHQSTAAEEALATFRALMASRQENHADAAARVAREAAAAAMEGLATINQQELSAFTPAINTLAQTVARESEARRTGEKQRRRSEAAAVESPTANMTNPVESPTIDTELSNPEDAPSPVVAPVDTPKSILKPSTDDTQEEREETPRRTIFQRISSTLSFSSATPEKRKARISFGVGNNDEVKTYVKEYTKESPLKQEDDDVHVVIYDRQIYKTWKRKQDEEFLQDFTIQLVEAAASRGDGSIIIKQILFVANAKHLLRDIPIQVLRAANRVAWPKEKKFFVNLSPVRRQIKSRLAKSYKIVNEYNMAKEAEEAEEQQANQEQLTDDKASDMDASKMEA